MTPPSIPFGRRVRRLVLRWALLLSVAYLGVIAVFFWLERSLVFRPASPAASWYDPVAPDTQDVWLTSADGTKLHGWWLPPARAGAGAVLLSHGNGGNVSHRGQLAADLRRTLGTGVLVYDYPGYGRSEGAPTEESCYAAGEAALAWLKDEMQIPPGWVVLLGESLGSGPAVELATRHDHRALVLMFPFSSLPAAAKFHYPWLPTHTLMRTRFDNLSKIGQCTRPVFIAHGTADTIVPFRQGEELFAAANEPKEFHRLDGLPHDMILVGEAIYEPLARFLDINAP